MMKKLILLVGVVCSFGMFAWAEQMQFVTTLSSPLGTFAQLETADHTAVTSVPLVNFCNTRASAGEITVKGADAYIGVLALKNGTTLGGNMPEFRISSALGVNNNATVTGGRLMANTASLSGASSAKSRVEESLYVASAKLKGAKTEALTIPGQVQTGAHGPNTTGNQMQWSSIRQVPECGSAGNSPAYTACSSFRTGPGGQDNFFCYKKPQSTYCSMGGGISDPISVTYLKDCPSYVRYDITCTQKAKYRTREITCN